MGIYWVNYIALYSYYKIIAKRVLKFFLKYFANISRAVFLDLLYFFYSKNYCFFAFAVILVASSSKLHPVNFLKCQ